MKQHSGLSSTAQKYLSGISSFNNHNQNNHKCQNCGLQFYSPAQLYNHKKKFCIDSGFDTIAGLNTRLKNPHYKQQDKNKRKFNDSLTNALQQVQKNKTFIPQQKQFRNDLIDYQKHNQQIQYVRPYIRQSRKQMSTVGRKSKSLFIKANEDFNPGQNRYYIRSAKKSSLNDYDGHQRDRTNRYSLTQSHVKKFKDQNSYISPPSQIPQLQNAKMFSLLDRSDMSIKNMSEQEKRQYVVRKLLQLENIQQNYKKNGGKSKQFVQNTKKMKSFYEKLLEDINNKKQQKFGKISNGTRVSTPISKLSKLGDSQILTESIVRLQDRQQSKLAQKLSNIHNKSMAKRQDKIRNRFKTENQDHMNQGQHNQVLDVQLMKKIQNLKSHQQKNQIIVIPINQLSPSSLPQNYNRQNDMSIKYLQRMMQMKNQQNKRVIEMIEKQNSQLKKYYQTDIKNKDKQSQKHQKKLKNLEDKYNKILNQQHKIKYSKDNQIGSNNNNFKISQIRHKTQYSQNSDVLQEYRSNHANIENVRKLKLQQQGFHLDSNQGLSRQQKVLLQMQKQQRDQLQLFSHLPADIQQIKLQSIKAIAEKRHQMQKQVIRQKKQKLQLCQIIQHFDLQRMLVHEQIENEKKKIDIHKLMKKKIKDIARKQIQQNDSQNQSQSEINENQYQYNDPYRYSQYSGHQNTRGSNLNKTQNITPLE